MPSLVQRQRVDQIDCIVLLGGAYPVDGLVHVGRPVRLGGDEPVDVAIFAAGERALHRQKYMLPAGASTLTITVDEQPREAGVAARWRGTEVIV